MSAQTISTVVQAVSTVVLVLITAWYAYHTRRMVGEMAAQRMEAAKPVMVVVRRQQPQAGLAFSLRIQNVGTGAAFDVRCMVEHRDITYDVAWLPEGERAMPYLPPQRWYEAQFSAPSLTLEDHPAPPDHSIAAVITYTDIFQRRWETRYESTASFRACPLPDGLAWALNDFEPANPVVHQLDAPHAQA